MTIPIEIRKSISDALASKRELTPSTLRTYTSLLSNIAVRLHADGPGFWVEEAEKILEYIANLEKPQTRKTILSALVVLTGDDRYRLKMLENINEVNKIYREQKVDPERVSKLKSFAEIQAIHDNHMNAYKSNPTHENTINVLISGLMSGVYPGCPPRRLMDYSEMRIRNMDKKEDNYSTATLLTFHKYKTAKHDQAKGLVASMPVPEPLRAILRKWVKLNTTDWLLLNQNGQKFSSSSLNKRLTSIYGFGCDMLRSIYLSDVVYKDVPKIESLENTAALMGHSVGSALSYYVKK